MDVQKYKILYKEGEAEISEKKSRFIAHIAPAQPEEEAQAFIEKIKKPYWDARHNTSWNWRIDPCVHKKYARRDQGKYGDREMSWGNAQPHL